MSDTDAVVIARAGKVGRIRLNRPKALNALTLESIGAITDALSRFRDDDGIALVLIDHIGEKGFCAGGDAIGLANSARTDGAWAHDYFARQYAMDALIAELGKPVVTLADGAVIGGGLGLLLNASHRVVTERTMIAFLETGIGMAPDVGASWVLPRLPGARGQWLALTGTRQIGEVCVAQGLADICVESSELEAQKAALCSNPAQLETIFPRSAPVEGPHDARIDAHFAHSSLEAIVASLESDDGEWAAKQLTLLRRASPTATVATFRLLQAGAQAENLRAALENELSTNMALLRAPDFLCFARANLIERDVTLSWNPPAIEQVQPDTLPLSITAG